jgi:hypothetical protein
LNDVLVERDSLAAALKSRYPQIEDKTLVLKADQAAEHGLVVPGDGYSQGSGLEKNGDRHPYG